jgi:hypothetical protein
MTCGTLCRRSEATVTKLSTTLAADGRYSRTALNQAGAMRRGR